MSKILLSIKPEYVEKILDGRKKFEFRKRISKYEVETIIVYSTSPAMKVLAEVKVEGILAFSPTKLWKKTKMSAGISREKYRAYFKGCKVAYAFKLGEVVVCSPPKTLQDYGVATPPQSFVYIIDTIELMEMSK